MENKKIGVCLIHNNESNLPGRVSQEKILKITSQFGFNFKGIEIYKQGIVPESESAFQNLRKLLIRNLSKRRAEYKLSVGLGISKITKIFSSIAGFGFYFFNLLISSVQRLEYRASTIEKFVSDKHRQALSWAVEENLDWLIVLESDAMWNEPLSNSRILDLMKLIQNIKNEYLYVNISGGYNLEGLGFRRLKAINELNGFVKFNAPIVNTACAYLVNIELAKEFVSHPWNDHLGIDWIYNMGLQRIDAKKLICLHMIPEGLNHGSFSGKTVSWQQKPSKKI